jgi:pimeloyl-ACP methyl ester carboxylesterase
MDAAASFDLVAPALADAGLRVVAPDLRGFGESDRVAGGGYYHFPDYVADVDALLDGDVFVIGHSMGGTIATLLAGTRKRGMPCHFQKRLYLIEVHAEAGRLGPKYKSGNG